MRVLITGITGFAGSHLAEHIVAEHPDCAVYGTYRWRSRMDNLDDLASAGRLDAVEGDYTRDPRLDDGDRAGRATLLHCDLTDPAAVVRLVETVRPDRVFHLAAQSFVQSSFAEPWATIHTNVSGELNLLEAVRRSGAPIRVHVAGSSEEYGLVRPDEVPIAETNPLRPLSPYAVSKVTQDALAWQYHRSYGLHVVTTRAFNHTGPRRGTVFATSTFARQIAEVEAGFREAELLVGDLTPKRDWHDVRDTARAYWLALETGEPGEVYNVGSGHAWSVGEMLDTLRGLSPARIEVRQDPARLRPSDVPILCADVEKFRARTGWQTRIAFRDTLHDLLTYWRARVTKEHLRLAGGV